MTKFNVLRLTPRIFAGQRTSLSTASGRGIACLAALSETHQILQKTCRDFANAELAPHARRHDREELFPAEQVRRLGEMGLMSVIVKEEYGGYFNMVARIELD